MFVKKLDTGEHFAIDPDTKEWHPPNEGDFDPFGDDSPFQALLIKWLSLSIKSLKPTERTE